MDGVYLGVDVGTSATRVSLVRPGGHALVASAGYRTVRAGRPVRAALTWQDTRATAEAAELADRFGDPEPLIGTALPWSAANLPAKLAWLARHEPDMVRRTRWLLQPKDLVGLWLTGSAASDPWLVTPELGSGWVRNAGGRVRGTGDSVHRSLRVRRW